MHTTNLLLLTGPLVTGHTAEFRKSKKSNWTSIGSAAPNNAEQLAADAIIASAEFEKSAAQHADDEAPEIVGEDGNDSAQMMDSGAHAGLQTASSMAAQMAKKAALERRKAAEANASGASGKHSETIYRDASGRIINVAMQRAAVRKKADEDAAKAETEREALKGDVQRAQAAQRRQQLEDAKLMTVARHADDEALNDELRDRERWNDPAAQFLSTTKKRGGGEGRGVTGKKTYQGPAAPNRYGIRPGWRWDGVDRSNGFEKEWFEARNRKKRIGELEYAWQMDE